MDFPPVTNRQEPTVTPPTSRPPASAVATSLVGDTVALSASVKPALPFGKDQFWLGANLPWVSYGLDFGANAWQPKGGLATPEGQAKVEAAFAKLSAAGVSHTRWFMLTDGRAGIRFGQDGTPLGLDDKIFGDVDAALAAARKHGIKITFSLIDFHWGHPVKHEGGVQIGGHADVISEPAKRTALIDKVFTPLFQRYGKDPNIETWEIINEPEWITFGQGNWKPWQGVWKSDMRAFIGEATAAAHKHATQPVTVGSASARTLGLVKGLGLDYYQAHWYDWFDKGSPLAKPVKDLKLDKPLVLGEFPSKGSKKEPGAILDIAKQAGYSGGFAWSAGATDSASDGAKVLASHQAFEQANLDKVVK